MRKLLFLLLSSFLLLASVTPAHASTIDPFLRLHYRAHGKVVLVGKNLTGPHYVQQCNANVDNDGLAACGGTQWAQVNGNFKLRWYPETGPIGNGVCDNTHPCLLGVFPLDSNGVPTMTGALFAYLG